MSGRGGGWRFRGGLTVEWSGRGLAVQRWVDRSMVVEGLWRLRGGLTVQWSRRGLAVTRWFDRSGHGWVTVFFVYTVCRLERCFD